MTLTDQPMRSRLPRSADRQTSSARWTSGGVNFRYARMRVVRDAVLTAPLSCAPERRGG
jgi:hypothetical protein